MKAYQNRYLIFIALVLVLFGNFLYRQKQDYEKLCDLYQYDKQVVSNLKPTSTARLYKNLVLDSTEYRLKQYENSVSGIAIIFTKKCER